MAEEAAADDDDVHVEEAGGDTSDVIEEYEDADGPLDARPAELKDVDEPSTTNDG